MTPSVRFVMQEFKKKIARLSLEKFLVQLRITQLQQLKQPSKRDARTIIQLEAQLESYESQLKRVRHSGWPF